MIMGVHYVNEIEAAFQSNENQTIIKGVHYVRDIEALMHLQAMS